jgi:myo-inositol-1(or 4)-monophosphatase
VKKAESKVYRDFIELENLQNSSSVSKFTSMTLQRLRREFFEFFSRNRNSYSLIVKDGRSNIVNGAKKTIYINCMAGVKNFMHSLPYFATVIGIKEKDRYVTAFVNNYATQEMFTAENGSGAFLNTRRIRVSNRNDLAEVMVGVKYDSAREKFTKVSEKINMNFKVNNCYILDICHTAAGKLDGGIIFDGSVEELEIGKLFVVESGGFFEFLNNNKTDCVYSNSLIHTGIKKTLE